MAFLAGEVSTDTYLDLMDQYHPCYRAFDHPSLDRLLTPAEFTRAVATTHRYGLHRLERG